MNKVLKLSPSFAPILERKLEELGFKKEENPNVIFSYRGPDLKVIFYKTGTVLIQGKGDAEGLIEKLLENLNVELDYAGTDEAGKGDIFGPLVVCGFVVKTKKELEFLLSLGVRDSKDISQKSLEEIAQKLMELKRHRCAVIRPIVYNDLYASFQNLNKLLSFVHANAIDGLFLEFFPKKAIVDRFMKGSFIDCYLNAPIELYETTGAERYPAVAAASILAKYLYSRELERLSKAVGVKLPAGSGPEAKKVFENLKAKLDEQALKRVAKLHFRFKS